MTASMSMNRLTVVFSLIALVLPLALSAARAEPLRARAEALFGAIEATDAAASVAPQADLGRALFWDARLSADGKTACASCHDAADWGADRRRRSPDARGGLTRRQAQTVFNAQLATAGLRWLADRADGVQQALSSITGSLGFPSQDALVARLRESDYAAGFALAFPDDTDALSSANYARALAVYQQTLATPGRFDAWLRGDDAALSERERRGLARFIDTGCAGCHAGPLFGGGSVQRFGVVADYRPLTGSTDDDTGRFEQTGDPADRDVFRVPPLRNVERTAPYFHDGAVASLAQAVVIMAQIQLGETLSPRAVEEIVGFLATLTGAVPAHYAPPDAGLREARE